MKKIGLVLPKPPGYSERFFLLKINGLMEKGMDIKVFSSSNQDGNYNFQHYTAFPTDQIGIIRNFRKLLSLILKLAFKASGPSARLFKLERSDNVPFIAALKSVYINAHILEHKLDWLHFEFATMAIGRENVAQAIGAKMSVSVRGFDIGIFPLRNPGCYDKMWSKIDKLHSISDDLYELSLKNGLNKEVPMKKITPAIVIEDIRKKELSGKINTPVRIVTTARLHWKKGLSYALEAMALLDKKGIKYQYTIVGEGNQYEELKFEIHQLNQGDKVKLAGRLLHQDLVKLLADSDIYLQPSVQEGFCNSVLEAQAAGLLCIVCNADGLNENVINEKTGWVVPKRDPGSLADKIAEVVGLEKNVRRKIIENAINRVNVNFGIEKQIKEFVEFYN